MESKLMKRINIQDIDLNSLEVILDKAGRWVDGVNHGRKILRDKDSFYNLFIYQVFVSFGGFLY